MGERGEHVVVGGLRYVVPYMTQQQYHARERHAGVPIVDVLAETFRLRRGQQPLEEARAYWRGEIDGGRIAVKRHKRRRDDDDERTQRFVRADAEYVVAKQDILQIERHVHERVVGGAEPSIIHSDGKYVVVNKPACVPCVDSEGGFNNVVTLASRLAGARLHLVHRLDLPVSGLLILSRGGKAGRLAMEEIAARRAAKVYLARVEGSFPEEAESRAALRFCSKADRAFCGDHPDAKPAETRFRVLARDAAGGTSLVEAAPRTGLRHQIRAHLAELGFPIVGDVRYGAAPPGPGAGGAEVYADDEAGTLRGVLERTRQEWCPKCDWVAGVLDKKHHSDVPRAEAPICLHAVHYALPGVGLSVTCPLPAWAAELEGSYSPVPPTAPAAAPKAEAAAEPKQ